MAAAGPVKLKRGFFVEASRVNANHRFATQPVVIQFAVTMVAVEFAETVVAVCPVFWDLASMSVNRTALLVSVG